MSIFFSITTRFIQWKKCDNNVNIIIEYQNINNYNINPQSTWGIKKAISLEPNVGLTSNQAVNSSLSIVSSSQKKIDQFRPWKDPGGPF